MAKSRYLRITVKSSVILGIFISLILLFQGPPLAFLAYFFLVPLILVLIVRYLINLFKEGDGKLQSKDFIPSLILGAAEVRRKD